MYDVVGKVQELENDKSLNYSGLILECFDTILQGIPPGAASTQLVSSPCDHPYCSLAIGNAQQREPYQQG